MPLGAGGGHTSLHLFSFQECCLHAQDKNTYCPNEMKSAENKESLKILALNASVSMYVVTRVWKDQTQAISLLQQMGNFP